MTAFRLLLLAGLLVRAAALPIAGTEDVQVWKTWSHAAATQGLLTIYGVGGDPPVRGLASWHDLHTTVDYPPGSVAALAALGHVYRHVDPSFSDSRWLTAALKLTLLLMDALACALMWRIARVAGGQHAGRAAVVFFWLNPALILDGAVLGYLDAWFAVPVLAAIAAAQRGAGTWAGAALGLAVTIKVQAVFAAPVVGLVLWHASVARIRTAGAAAAACCAVVALALLPFAVRGALPNLLNGVGSLLRHDMLSGYAANLWWIVTWGLRVWYAIPDIGAWASWTMTTRILGVKRVVELGYPNPRPFGSMMAGGAALWGLYRAHRAVVRSAPPAVLFAAGAFAIHAYFILALQVHENHLYLALPLMGLAAAVEPRYRTVTAAVSAMMMLNLLLFYGIGRDFPVPPRNVTLVDTTVLLSFAHLFVFGWHARTIWAWSHEPPPTVPGDTVQGPRPAPRSGRGRPVWLS